MGNPEDICGYDAYAICNNSMVTEIWFEEPIPLDGTIGSELLALTGMTALTFRNTKLQGTLSTYLGALTNLLHLDLSFNSYSGTLPTELARLTKLELLDLAFNQFDGEVPAGFTALTRLTFLDVSRNKLSGSVPQLSFVRQCILAGPIDSRFATDGNCFDNCDNETICCELSVWPCGDMLGTPESDGSVALIVGVVLGVLLFIAMVVVVVVVVRKSHTSGSKPDEIEVRINNNGYAAASEMADNGLPPSQQLTPQVSAKYSNPLDNADTPTM